MIEILKSVPFFAQLPDKELKAISDKVIMEYYPVDYVLFSEGDTGNKMYIIKTGSAQVIRGNAVVSELQAGEFFGEMALVSDEPRNATVKTTSEVELLVIKKNDFKGLLETHAQIASMVSYEVVKRANENN
ncbi:MAG: cyclic nucleotide-binding domain-containing protein [Candidatus Peregrinibacteria bacterium]